MKRVRQWKIVAGLTIVFLLGGMFSGICMQPAQAIGLGDLIKVGGIVLLVSTYGGQINNFINKALGEQRAASVGATKVVPIFSVGRGAYIGAAQVVGLPENVRITQGVVAVEVSLGGLQGSALVPISTKKPGKSSLSRVSGVGVGAIIDFHI
jgi:hypothetical protein